MSRENKYSSKLKVSSEKTVCHFKQLLKNDGSFGADVTDISFYFKAPMMLILYGDTESATKIMTYLEKKFIKSDGDCSLSDENKSIKGEYSEFWSYINGWIIRAANKLDVYSPEVMQKLMGHMEQYHLGDGLGFVTHRIPSDRPNDGITDILTTAHHGLLHLEAGNMQLAQSAGKYLLTVLDKQPDLKDGCFYLRFDSALKPLAEGAPFNRINQKIGGQLYFMLGYPAAYLAILYKDTKDPAYLDGATRYMKVVEGCGQNVLESMWSHKVAWAASLMLEITGEEKYRQLARGVLDHIWSEQDEDSGLWHQPAPDKISRATAYDQSAEIASWMLTIAQLDISL